MFTLETDRLLIRPWQPDADRAAFMTMSNDLEVMRYVHGGVPYADEEIDEFFVRQGRQHEELGVCMGALVEKESNLVIGVAGIQPLGATGNLEIGWWLAREVWGRGYATEAGRAAMSHVLETLGRPRVMAIIDPGNDASVRVVERLGFKYEGRKTGTELGHRKPHIVVDLYSRERGGTPEPGMS
jgi:RimJ/RimL family protein N-acetyltransferase